MAWVASVVFGWVQLDSFDTAGVQTKLKEITASSTRPLQALYVGTLSDSNGSKPLPKPYPSDLTCRLHWLVNTQRYPTTVEPTNLQWVTMRSSTISAQQ